MYNQKIKTVSPRDGGSDLPIVAKNNLMLFPNTNALSSTLIYIPIHQDVEVKSQLNCGLYIQMANRRILK
jgi:hypothetical protein